MVGWLPASEKIKIFPQRNKRINLFGVFPPDNFCLTYNVEENINSEVLIQSVNDLLQKFQEADTSVGIIFWRRSGNDWKKIYILPFAEIFTELELAGNLRAQSQI